MFSLCPLHHLQNFEHFRIGQDFFDGPIILKCLICNEGQSSQLPSNLIKFFEMNSKKIPFLKRKALHEIKCESCEENDAIFSCLGCSQQKYCDDCLKVHQKNKKFSQHKTVSLDESNQMRENSNLESIQNCKCAFQRKMEYFCQKCQCSVCKFCSKNYHDNHQQIPLSEIFDETKRIEFKKIEKKLSEFKDDFVNFKTKFLQTLNEELMEQNKNFDH